MRTYFDKTTGVYLGSWNWPPTPEQLNHPDLAGHLWKEEQVAGAAHRLNLLTDTVELIPIPYDYISQRRAAYPHIGDQLDAMWKGGAAEAAMLAAVLAVKAKYPKP